MTEPVVRRGRGGGSEGEYLGYEPSLDGLRALAVVAVLFFHARFSWAPGGFLGVSTFFTLSGFLITSLMIKEWRSSGGVSLRGFFSRRFRRLLPASWFTMGLVLAMGAVGVWANDQLRSLRGDVPWALLELVNWHFIAEGRSYGAQFEAPSPLEHYWSLAIEQQFYLLLPVALLVLLGWSQRRALARDGARSGPATTPLRPLVVVLVVAAVASWSLNWYFAQDSVARSYFGTDTRLAELALGALLATVGLRRIRNGSTVRNRALAAVGILGLLASLVLWSTATVGAQWMYPFGFMATAAASTMLILGALQPGPLRWVLELAPVVALGKISYGVYLLHWPIFLWLTPARTGWGQWPLFGLRMAVTITASVVMFRLLETPIRSGSRLVTRVSAGFVAPVAVALLVVTAVVTSDLPGPSELASAVNTTTTTVPPAPVRVLVIGDALAESWRPLAGATSGSSDTDESDTDDPKADSSAQIQITVPDTGAPLEVTVAASPDCGVVLGGFVRLSNGELERDTDRCGKVHEAWADALLETRPDVVLVWAAPRDVADRRLDTVSPWSKPGVPELDDFLSVELRELLDTMSATGSAVVLGTSPHFTNNGPAPAPVPQILPPEPVRRELARQAWIDAAVGIPGPGYAENDNARIDRWNDLMKEAASATGTEVLDLAAMMQQWPGGEFDPQLRAPDGVGLTPDGVAELAQQASAALETAKPPIGRADATAAVAAAAPLPPAPPFTARRTVPSGRSPKILVVGDSVAYNIGFGLTKWTEANGGARVHSAGQLGCPIARGGQFRFLLDIDTFEDHCDWAPMFPEWVNSTDPEVVVLTSGIWEVVDRRLPGDDRFRHVGEPIVDRYMLAEFLSAIDTLAARGANVVLLTYPHFEAGRDQGYTDLPESDPARVDRLNELLAEAVALRPGVATLLDFQGWLASQPGGELDPAKRSDGLHFYDEYAPTIADWLAPQLVETAHNGIPPPPGG